jgi:beta-glucanase (GH16 family)
MRTSLRSRLCIAGTALLALVALIAPASGSSPAAFTTSTAAPSCGGEVVVKPDGSQWQCTFDDEFDGTALNTALWNTQVTSASAYHSGAECFVNSPNNVSVGAGVLSLTVRKEAAPFTCQDKSGNFTTQYTSGMVNTSGTFSQTYGRFEIRARFPSTTIKGLQESLWMWPVDVLHYGTKWPQSGELDIAEMYTAYPTLAIPYIHYVPATLDLHVTNNYCTIKDIGAFHTYVMTWTPTAITIAFDGRNCIVDKNWNPYGLTHPAPFDQPFFLNITQALGVGKNLFDPATTPLPATTQVDYVRAWQ